MPTCLTNDEAQCPVLNSPKRPYQLVQMYQYDRNQQQSPQAVLSVELAINIEEKKEQNKKMRLPFDSTLPISPILFSFNHYG